MRRPLVFSIVFIFASCKFPLGPSPTPKNEKRNTVLVRGIVVCENETLDGISVALFPYEIGFSSLIVSPAHLERVAYALGVTEQKHFEFEIPIIDDTVKYFLLTGLGMHNKDKDYVQPLRLRFDHSGIKISSDIQFVVDKTLSTRDTLFFELNLVRKVYLFVPGTGAIWQSGDTLLLNPTLASPVLIRWFYPNANYDYPSHTRFIFVLWSLEDGILYYTPSTYAELLSQPPAATSKIFPETQFESSILVNGRSYRITIIAVTNITNEENITGVPTELLFDGKFTYILTR